MHLRPCLAQPLSYSAGFSLVSWDPSPPSWDHPEDASIGTLACMWNPGRNVERHLSHLPDAGCCYTHTHTTAHQNPSHLGMVNSVARAVTSQILMHLSMETDATFWLSGSKQHAVMDLL